MNLRLRVPIPKPHWYAVILRVAGVLTLCALALMVWSVVQPTPMPVLLAMSFGQVLGTAAFAMYGLVVFADLRRQWAHRKEIEKHGGLPPRMTEDDAPPSPAPAVDTAPASSPPPDKEASS